MSINGDKLYIYHGGPGSGRWPLGSSGNTPGSRQLYKHNKRIEKMKQQEARKAAKQGTLPKMDKGDEVLREVTPKELKKRNKLDKKVETITKQSKNDKPKNDKSSKNDKTGDVKKDETPKKKTKEEMTTQELWNEVNRVKAEKAYDEIYNPKKPNPEKVRLERAADTANTTSKVLNSTKSGLDSASNVARTIAAEARKVPSKEVKEQLSQMSNKEIQDRIYRIRLENEYASLNPSKQAIAAERTAGILQGIGHLAAVGSSIASIAASMNELRARRLD